MCYLNTDLDTIDILNPGPVGSARVSLPLFRENLGIYLLFASVVGSGNFYRYLQRLFVTSSVRYYSA